MAEFLRNDQETQERASIPAHWRPHVLVREGNQRRVRAIPRWRARRQREKFSQYYRTPLTPEQQEEQEAWRIIKTVAAHELWRRSTEREQSSRAAD